MHKVTISLIGFLFDIFITEQYWVGNISDTNKPSKTKCEHFSKYIFSGDYQHVLGRISNIAFRYVRALVSDYLRIKYFEIYRHVCINSNGLEKPTI